MRFLIVAALITVFTSNVDAQLLRWRRCPPSNNNNDSVIVVSPPVAPVRPEMPYYPIQQIMPQPVPMPSPSHGQGLNLGNIGLNLHYHMQGQSNNDGGDSLVKLAMVLKMLDNRRGGGGEDCDGNDIDGDTESIKMMMLMKMMADHRTEDADEGGTIQSLIQALVDKKNEPAVLPESGYENLLQMLLMQKQEKQSVYVTPAGPCTSLINPPVAPDFGGEL